MGTVLCLSSQVARGYVGGSAARVALERLGHETWLLPTVVLTGHRGHRHSAGPTIAPGELGSMLDALEREGRLREVDAVLTGYMPGPAHAEVALDAVSRVRGANGDATVLCDPCCGDAPGGLYVADAAAEAVRDLLVPGADMARLNLFELAWLTGRSVMDGGGAVAAARALGPAQVFVTSAPADDDTAIANLLVTGDAVWSATLPRRGEAPHGTGDLAAALFLGHRLGGAAPELAFACAVAGVQAALETCAGADELRLATDMDAWAAPAPWAVDRGEG